MRLYLDSIASFLQERTAEELIVGVFLALLLAIAAAGVHALARHKVKDTVVLLTVVGLIANLMAMTFTASYFRMKLADSSRNPGHIQPRSLLSNSQVRDYTFEATARAIFQAADLDRDGGLSPAEAAEASARFVELVESEAGRPIDWPILGTAIKKRVRVFDGHPVDRDHPPWPAPALHDPLLRPVSEGETGPTAGQSSRPHL